MDTLMFMLGCGLQESWGDKVERLTEGNWEANGDEWNNPSAIYLTANETRRYVRDEIRSFFNPSPEVEVEPEDLLIVNHWAKAT